MNGVTPMILGLLHLAELSSYDLKKNLEKLASHYFSASLGSIVPALKKLEAEGLIQARDASVGKRPKHLYSPTPKGKKAFSQWLRQTPDLERDEDGLLARIFFFGLLDKKERKEIVKETVDQLNEMQDRLKALKRQTEKEVKGLELPPAFEDVPEFQIATIDFGISNYRSIERWLKKRFL